MAVQRVPAQYVARSGSRINNADARVVGVEFEAIAAATTDGITAEAVLARAATPGTPLYEWDQSKHWFEWDDEKAAQQHRQSQARLLIRSVEIRVEGSDEKPVRTRAFYVVENDERLRSYKPVDTVVANEEYVRQVKDRFTSELLRLHSQYVAFMAYEEFKSDFGQIIASIEDVVGTRAEQKVKSSRYRQRGGHVVLTTNGS